MKVFAISDLHLSINNPKPMDIFGCVWQDYTDKIVADWKNKVTDDDVVILAGDFSWAMKLEDAVADFRFISDLPGKKILIKGNHDYWWSSISKVRNLLPPKIYCLQNDAVKFGNLVFCGSRGWILPEGKDNTEFNQKIFNRELIRLELSLKQAKQLVKENDRLIFITHYPPFGANLQPTKLTELVGKYNVNKVIFGHLHGYVNKNMFYNQIDQTEYYLSSCDALNNQLLKILE